MRVVGVDIGGTFTDFMLYDTESGAVHVHKVPLDARRSRPGDGRRARRALRGRRASSRRTSTASSTARRSRRTRCSSTAAPMRGMITTKGFRDVVHIGRHQRPQHYSIMQDIPWQARPFVKRRHRKVVSERIVPPTRRGARGAGRGRGARRGARAARGRRRVGRHLLPLLVPQPGARAARRGDRREEIPDAFVTASADIFPQFREFERFTTASHERVRRARRPAATSSGSPARSPSEGVPASCT